MATEFRHEHRREALIGTLLLHGLLALLFLLIVFKNPPDSIAEMGDGGGVELNYGVDQVGDGDVQTSAQANESPNREDSKPPAQQPDPEPQQASTPTPPTPPEDVQEKVVTSEAEENDVKIPPVEKPTPRPREEPTREPVKEPEPEKPKVNQRAIFTPRGATANTGGNGVNGTSNNPAGNNNGDNPGTVGDKGDPRGTYTGKAYSGDPGSGGGSGGGDGDGFAGGGWAFTNRPKAELVDNQNGYLRFKIKINSDGDVESIEKVGGNMSAEQVRICRDVLNEQLSVRKLKPEAGAATGFFTFRFKVE
ncbi:hypothetical protein [Hymenobacter sp. CRA2]|uniref:hypothetical protein n=1 Tax=Hymenobacter sp. CRA2 TaxID=1955620 RepID=UPI00098F2A27|nr:hypothetical protein [Hymenobacter sp. CRA2]OON67610.1 hypothetical protein B0919_17440 [Hymenobacter sp. CRA2]